ncbi:unnamed protein product [Mytilus coruscus]|uniref:Uncharacterized protein n=1 Tax=Mytilus coruscus TaxID=42192 RepID=A0A6J8EGC0_MYTCO|nr:unnamed protein product [Mytilus coruscus]
MYRSLSLKRNRKEQDSKKDPDYLDLSGDKEISEIKYSPEKTMAETEGENLTQLDLKNTSLSLNFRSSKQEKLKKIRAKVNQYALDEFIETSDELITIFISKAEYVKGKLIDNLDDSTEEGRQKLFEAQGQNLNLIEIWDTKYNDYIKDYDKKISGPKEPAKKTFIATNKRDGRNFPYKRRN